VDFERQFAATRFDAVIDMICFTPEQAASDVRAFRGRCEQFIFCSTVCTYGVKMPPQVLVDELFRRNRSAVTGATSWRANKSFVAPTTSEIFK